VIEALLQAERLLVHGMVDQAEQIYASAIDSDPRNAIAVVGLARVALERGDERLAFDRAREALEIDPENAAALRLETRLREVFADRQKGHSAAPAPAAAEPTDKARPSERAFLLSNPSMADHQKMEEERAAKPAAPPDEPETEPERRPGILRRILRGR